MGYSTMPKYESWDLEADRHKTQEGGFEHNGMTGLKAESSLSTEQARRPKAADPAATMVNDQLSPDSQSQAAEAHTDGYELDVTFGLPVQEKSLWAGLYESVQDIFFPPKLPPLELTSKPIPVPDRMAVKRNPWAVGIAIVINSSILAAGLFFGVKKIIDTAAQNKVNTTNIELTDFKAPKAKTAAGGGGGGGDHSMIDPSKGHLPKIEKNPVVAPQVQTIEHPKLPMEAAIDVQKEIKLPDNPMLPNIGVKSSANVKLASNGSGGGGGIGSGYGGGIGSGSGNGYGPGSGGNAGGGIYHLGGGVSAPVPLNSVEAEFSDEARRAKYQGIVLVGLIVDAQGNPQNVHVVRALGMGLDEKAIEAVRKYKFRPAMKNGKPVAVDGVTVSVDFRLY